METAVQNAGVWSGLSKSIAETIEAVQDSIVTVHGGGRTTSSGVVWRPGVVVTVRHGLRRSDSLQAAHRGEPFPATLAGADAGTDLAVHGEPESLPSLELGALAVRLPRAHTWRLYGFGLALFLALTIALSWIFGPWGSSSPTVRSLAVLPLENISGDASQEYFADGMTDELITDLGKIRATLVGQEQAALDKSKAIALSGHEAYPADSGRSIGSGFWRTTALWGAPRLMMSL